ncbi:hypothetical protein HL658_32100 [Azospirillum sp. RWY-5-1]|uniref:Major tail protein n=1 Tax=Azospirillum oleiclasticum TaxID=2735135 RepID=A0ABX2TFY6_9PROT|nr:hypothetical protein [Azospirillum oleiclasticum]NYZ17212.1 hypothetical protein [Azospirillum oleiclasticum]NYZ23079.1 hypothetical protein [Azospirillum oleiclasticum]
MPSDVRNVKLGACRISYNGQDLGFTKGGVEVEVTTQTKTVVVDQDGTSAVNEFITGRGIKVKAPLAETTIDNLAHIMPAAALTAGAGENPPRRLNVRAGTGTSLVDEAHQLVLHPAALPGSDTSEDLVIPHAATTGAVTFAYKAEEERIFKVEFIGFADPTTKLLFFIGNENAPAA